MLEYAAVALLKSDGKYRWTTKLLDGLLPALGGQLGLWIGRAIVIGGGVTADWLLQLWLGR